MAVHIGQFAACRHHAIPIFLSELQRTVDKVTIYRHQFVVVTILKIAPCKVIVLRLRCIRSEHIAQHILLSREVAEIFVQPDCPVARGRNLVVLQIEELISRHIVGHDIATMRLHHHGEDNAVEHDIVLTDEVNEPRILILPPFLPIAPTSGIAFTQFFRIGHIADRRVKPHVEHLSLSPFNRHGNAPVQIAGHRPRLKIHIKPRLTLPIDIRTPLFMPVENPLLQPLLIFIERQIPVLRLLHDRHRTADGRFRIDQFRWREVAPTFLTLVAISPRVMTMRTFTRDITVSQKLMSLLVIILLRRFLRQLPLVIKLAKESRRHLMMRLTRRPTIDIKRNAKFLKRILNKLMIAVNDILRRDPFLSGTDSDRHAMFVRPTDEHHLLFFQTQVTHINICRHIYTRQMSDMNTPIGIRQCRCDCRPLILFLLHILLSFIFCLQS